MVLSVHEGGTTTAHQERTGLQEVPGWLVGKLIAPRDRRAIPSDVQTRPQIAPRRIKRRRGPRRTTNPNIAQRQA